MICRYCGGEVVWCGRLSDLTHTECRQCGAVNAQIPEDENYEDDDCAENDREE